MFYQMTQNTDLVEHKTPKARNLSLFHLFADDANLFYEHKSKLHTFSSTSKEVAGFFF